MKADLKRIYKEEKQRYTVPKSVRDYIPINTIFEDGIMKCGNLYTKTFSFSDINYLASSNEEKENLFIKYEGLLNSLASDALYKISIVNTENTAEEENAFEKEANDGLDGIRKEYLRMSKPSAKSVGTRKYITVSVSEKSYEDAAAALDRIGSELKIKFSDLTSRCEGLDAGNKLKLLSSLYNPSGGGIFSFDMRDAARFGYDFKEYIAPHSIERHADYIMLGDTYVRTLFIKDYASYIKDTFLTEITDMPFSMSVSLDILPAGTDEAIREVERKLLGVETNIENYERRMRRKNASHLTIPYDMELQKEEAREFLNDLKSRDQRMMFGLITAAIYGKTLDELNLNCEKVISCARKHMCQLSVLKFNQTDGLNNALPLGVMPIDVTRTLTTESAAVFMPFKVQEIDERGGIYLGRNSISLNRIMCNRENLVNQSAVILGVPGSGKSMTAKSMILQTYLTTNDDILICDPEGEYSAMIRSLNISDASIIELSSASKSRLNAMYMEDGYGDDNAVAVKSEFIMSLIEQIDPKGADAKSKSIIDRCILETYKASKREGITPTLTIFRDCLMSQSEKEAKDIALTLELYTKGSLDIFAHEGNADLSSRLTLFDIRGLSSQLKSAAMLVITDTILNRVILNFKKGKRTHVFIDEFHVVYENEYSAQFFTSAWRQFRKRNAFPTAITQNVEYLLESVSASTMLSNSEFIVMLSQAPSDRVKLRELLNISPEQMNYVTSASPGAGLIKYGPYIVPFDGKIDANTRLYSLMSTKPGEGAFNGEA